MEIRYLKILLVIFVSLIGLLNATQNMVNLDAAYYFVATVAGMEGHTFYPNHLGPGFQNSFLVWAVLAGIILGEYLVGFLAAKGAWDMWQARAEAAAKFQKAKKFAVLGCAMALIVWYGLFTVIGGAYFQMWQTELGLASLEGAFQYAATTGIVLLFIHMKDD